MRQTLTDLFNNTVTLCYKLPNSVNDCEKSIITTSEDFAFQAKEDNDIVELIYNGIVDLAYDDYKIDINRLNELQRQALDFRIRFNVNGQAAKIKLGFYGEVLLNIFLQVFFGTDVFVARGEFFDLLANSEVKGYDCHHIIQRGDCLEFWFGEVKFYGSYKPALKKIWGNLNKDISFDYLNKNLQTVFQKRYEIYAEGSLIDKFVNDCKAAPYRNLYDDIKRYNGKLIYPILLVADEIKDDFEESIKSYIKEINELNKENPVQIPNNLTVELFFIFLPVKDATIIKEEVLECIQKNKPLI